MIANYTRQDEWEREIYTTPSGEEFAMIDGSLASEPILYALERDGEPSHPIREDGAYITADRIQGVKPIICWNCNHHISIRYASKLRAEYRKRLGEEDPEGADFLCRDCQELKESYQ